MARQSRLVVPNQPHHILQRGNDRQPVFREEEDYRAYLGWLKEAARSEKVAIHAYVLMPNHVHILASPSEAEGMAHMMQKLGRHYVPYFNHRYGRTGTLWEGRFKTSFIDSEQYFLECSRYIELNPVRAGLAYAPDGYAWSSYRHHAGLLPDSLITDHDLYWALGNTPFQREAAYTELVQQALAADAVRKISDAVLKNLPLGSAQFLSALQKKTQRQIMPGKRGRPFKKPVE